MPSTLNSVSRCKPGLGTFIKISMAGSLEKIDLLRISSRAFDELDRIESLMSFHDPESELSRINRTPSGSWIDISAEMAEVLSLALGLSRATQGAFDITVADSLVERGFLPDHGNPQVATGHWPAVELQGSRLRLKQPVRLDLGGIAKGYAVDCAFRVIPEGVEVAIEAGGDLRMRPWQNQAIGLRSPGCDQEDVIYQTEMRDEAVATSGVLQGQLGACIIHPKTRKPLDQKVSFSVFAPTCMIADALTKVGLLYKDCETVFRDFGCTGLSIDAGGKTLFVG